MIYTLNVRNVNHALPQALALLRDHGLPVSPRGMLTYELPDPVATTYTSPTEMVLFDRLRDANPFFHFFESLWILRGRDDVQFLAWFLPRMAEFSDDGKRFHAPYGYRLRKAWGIDQIEGAIEKLKADPNDRQAVMSIWHPATDLHAKTKDIPCNDMIMLKVRNGALRMTVANRSNDVVWGAYGANVVQFSMLLAYMAARIGVDVGTYTQVSDSFHVYESNDFWKKWRGTYLFGVPTVDDPYSVFSPGSTFWERAADDVKSRAFDADLSVFFMLWDRDFRKVGTPDRVLVESVYDSWAFRAVVIPMLRALLMWRQGDKVNAASYARSSIGAIDWAFAAGQWMERRVAQQETGSAT